MAIDNFDKLQVLQSVYKCYNTFYDRKIYWYIKNI